jgi:hypothetical protein
MVAIQKVLRDESSAPCSANSTMSAIAAIFSYDSLTLSECPPFFLWRSRAVVVCQGQELSGAVSTKRNRLECLLIDLPRIDPPEYSIVN